MKLNKAFIVHAVGEETVLVPAGNAGFSGVVRGNRSFGAILELLKEETDEERVVAAMHEKFEAPAEQIEKDVRKVISELRGIGALDD